MAPYAVAHLKLGLLLQETGYQFKSDQRLGIYLTNTLEEAFKKSEQLAGFNEYIVDEANAAAEIKKDKPIMVVLGNPPYSGHSANKSPWAKQLVEIYKMVDGKPLGEKNPKWLQDDYVKFIRFGQWRIERTGQGVLGFITNHAYLDNPTFRGMRQSLMNTFTDIYILDLHGNAKKREVAPDGSKDQNVFDIQQGVAIGLFIKDPGKASPASVHYADLYGLREGKYHTLSETDVSVSDWKELKPDSPFYFFVPLDEELLGEYEQGWKVTDVFPINVLGVQTHRDDFAIDFEEDRIRQRIIDLRNNAHSDEELREMYGLSDNRDWQLSVARKRLQGDAKWEQYFTKCLYRPFDCRFCYFSTTVMDYPRRQLIDNVFQRENICLLVPRQTGTDQWQHAAVSKIPAMDVAISAASREANQVFPLYLYPAQGEMQLEKGRRPNLNPEFIKTFSEKLGLAFVEDSKGDLVETFGPEDIFNYAYAVFYSPTYRSRYAQFLKIDFPRLPLTSNKELFKALVAKGAELVALHLMESPKLNDLITKYALSGSNVVEKVSYDENNKRVYINKLQYFEGVPSEVWNFQIGGYQVCEKWLKDRKARTLTYDDLTHYQKIVVALKETMRLMKEIDSLVPLWPIQ
jgi:predicted helicase